MANYPNLIHIRKWNIRSVTKAYHSNDSTYVSNFISDVMEPVHFIENLPPRDTEHPREPRSLPATQHPDYLESSANCFLCAQLIVISGLGQQLCQKQAIRDNRTQLGDV